MARGGTDLLFKKNNKLESYLKRSLTDETFERVRAYESCIVVSEKESKAFKYVILGDEWIYLTENPPKHLQETVSLKDIISVELDEKYYRFTCGRHVEVKSLSIGKFYLPCRLCVEISANGRNYLQQILPLVNEFPDFLSGDERENTQHIAIKYWTTDSLGKRWSLRRSRKSPRPGSAATDYDRSNASTPLGFTSTDNWSETDGFATQSMSSLQIGRPDSRSSVGSNRDTGKSGSIKKKKNRLGESSDETWLKSLKEEKEELDDNLLEDIEENDVFNKSHLSSSFKQSGISRKESQKSQKDIKSVRSEKTSQKQMAVDSVSQTGSVISVRHQHKVKADAVDKNKEAEENAKNKNLSQGFTQNPGTVEEDPKGSFCCCLCFNCFKGKNQILPFCGGKGQEKSSNMSDYPMFSNEKNGPPPEIVTIDVKSDISRVIKGSTFSLNDAVPQSRRSSITTIRVPSRAGTPGMDGEPFNRSTSNLAAASYSDFGGSINGLSALGTDGAIPERRKVILNIYLLNLHSPMLMLIRSAWSNYLIRCTMLQDPEYEKAYRSSVFKSQANQSNPPVLTREKMELLFSQLKRELLNSDTMEDSFQLLTELKIATEKNFALKKMFWKNSDMFLFLVKQLQRYLPKSPININTEQGRIHRIDEFDYVILLTDMLSLMFRESEIIPARIQTLKAERGRYVLDLLMVLTCTPEVPEKYSVPCRSAASVRGSFKGRETIDTSVESEIENQLIAFTKTSLSAVYELFLMAKQANWGYSEGNFFNISWMVRVLEEIRTTEKYVERVISQMMKLIGPTRKEPLEPSESVLLYTQFSVIETFLEYSPRIAAFIKNNYLEEFKYFVQVSSIMQKVPRDTSYPVMQITKPLIEKVMMKVMEKQKTLYPKSPR